MDREGPLPLSGLGEFEVQASDRWLPVAACGSNYENRNTSASEDYKRG
jgi:hypothetical protein